MNTRQRRRSRLGRLLLPGIAVAFLAYFGFWLFHGYYGVWAKERLEREAAELRAVLAALDAEKADLERRIALLRPANLDPDLVDERARETLNVLRPGELVVFYSPRDGAR